MEVETAAILGGSMAAAFVSGATSIVLWFLNNKKNKDDKSKAIRNGVQLLMYDKIKYLALHHIANGYIYSDQFEDLQRMHKCYHSELNGNGYLDNIMRRVEALPMKNEKGA